MKKTLFVLLCLFGLVSTGSANRVVDVSKSNGLFGYYNYITQTFMGYFSSGSEWWTLECHGPGFNRCRLVPTAGKTVHDNETENIEDAKLDDLMVSIETDQINNGVTSGSMSKHYQATLSDNTTVDMYIDITWSPDPSDSNNTLYHASLTHT